MGKYHYVPERDDELNSRSMLFVSEHTGLAPEKCEEVIRMYIEFWSERPKLFNQFMAKVDPNHIDEDVEDD